MADATWVGADGRRRCAWLPRDEADFSYHDEVWGTPTRDERALFEASSLGVFEIGMSWSVVFRKRQAFLDAFDHFQPTRVAAYTDDDVLRLLSDSGIVRNRRKISAVISNARVVAAMTPKLAEVVWSFVPAAHQSPASLAGLPATSAEAQGLSAALKQAGFTLVGPVSIHAFMQSAGVVNDHIRGCFRALTS
jgi:DNA-3-methyladenine glycosylase I